MRCVLPDTLRASGSGTGSAVAAAAVAAVVPAAVVPAVVMFSACAKVLVEPALWLLLWAERAVLSLSVA
jgi:hypothetical protein